MTGPSPRGWGERSQVDAGFAQDRTIPTRVGRTSLRVCVSLPRTDHPHAGGENVRPRSLIHKGGGPSPRGWGEHGRARLVQSRKRTIPTRVGRTATFFFVRTLSTDHPHAGGENFGIQGLHSWGSGPSPRGWGERWSFMRPVRSARTIPTRVGRTERRRCRRCIRTDHPHAGGENSAASVGAGCASGPSPRGWGELCTKQRSPKQHRTIPTRVGRTLRTQRGCRGGTDHPHAGGENVSTPW